MIFILSTLWWIRIRDLWKLPDGRDWLWNLGLVLMGGAMLSKFSIQFSVDGWSCVPSLLFGLRLNYGGGNEENGDLLQKNLGPCCCIKCPGHAAGHCRPTPPWKTLGQSQGSLAQSLVGTLLLSPGPWCAKGCLCPRRVCFPSSVEIL